MAQRDSVALTADGVRAGRIGVPCVALAVVGGVLGGLDFFYPPEVITGVLQLALGWLAARMIMDWSRRGGGMALSPATAVAASTGVTVVLAMFSAGSFANSGDEYGYLYLADTLLHGRLWNAPPPAPDLFRVFYIWTHEGKTFSQFPPGWPGVLVPFVALGLPQLANPCLTLLTGLALVAALRRLAPPAAATGMLAALILLSPFVTFNGASYFNHTQAAAAVMLICWLQLRDEARSALANRIGIGVCFSVLLLTRYEAFAIVLVLFTLDRLLRRRLRFLGDAVAIGAGGLPLTLCLLAYNWAITGSPWRTTLGWAVPQLSMGLHGIGHDGPTDPIVAIAHQVAWAGGLFAFAGALPALLYAAALALRIRARAVRFYDLLLPATIAFFVFFPDYGGHQYGPRYWFFAWPPAALTIAAALAASGPALRLGGWRLQPAALTSLNLALFAGFTVVFGLYVRLYFDQRREVLAAQPPALPAVVLVPTRQLRLDPWQIFPHQAFAADFTRNGVDFDKPVLFGLGDDERFTPIACSLRGRAVYRWVSRTRLDRVTCPAASDPP